MITQEQIELITEILVNRTEKLNTKILREIGKSIKKLGTLKQTDIIRLSQIIKYGGSYETILEELAKATELNKKDIIKIFESVSKKDYEFANKFYKYRNIDMIPFEKNVMLQNQIKSLAMTTIEEYVRQTSMLGFGLVDDDGKVFYKGMREAFNELIDEAVLSVSQGKETYRQAMYRQLKEMGSGGLRVIYPTTYIGKDGKEHHYTRRLDSVVRTSIQDGLRTLHNENMKVLGEGFDADGYEISVHINPAPDHAEVQGRQFSKSEYDKLNMGEFAEDYKGKTYTLDHDGKNGYRPIGEMNCYHYIFPIILGASDPEYTDNELKQIIKDNEKGFEFEGNKYTMYQGTQLQRQLETKIREQKDAQILAKEAGQDDLVRETQKNITDLTKKYKELSEASGLPTKMQRLRVSGYKRTKVITPEPKKDYRTFEQLNLDDDVWIENFEFGDPSKLNISQEEKDTYNYFYKEFYEKFDMKDKEDVRKAVEDYTDENARYNYRTLNPMLRSGNISAEAQEKIDLINEGTNMYEVPTDMLLYRGITGEKAVNRYLNVGSIVEEKGFLSTTVLKGDTELFMEDLKSAMLEIEVDKGTKGLYIGIDTMSMAEQNELLFGTGKKLKVLSVEDIDKYTKKIRVKMMS